MKITHLKVNHLVNPIGYRLANPTVSFVAEDTAGKWLRSARVLVAADPDFQNILHDSGERPDIRTTAYELPITPEPETRYYWKVFATADNGDSAESETAWFETAKAEPWAADWITPCADKHLQISVFRDFEVTKPVQRARLYLTGLGLYEAYLNGKKMGDECLMPGFCDYDAWIPYQTLIPEIAQGHNRIEIVLADGWYKGWYGLRKNHELYGDRLACIAELKLFYTDGTSETICSDTSWKARKSPVTSSGIYPGEVFEPGIDRSELLPVERIGLDKGKLQPRLDPPLRIQKELRPVSLIHTPAKETVLDMGQNMVGWLGFYCDAPKGTRIRFQFGEILQKGNFYRDNLRTAPAEFTYVSDGTARQVRQHFTFFGFRYVKITGWPGEPDLNAFRGLVIHSEMEELSQIETSDPLVNKLFENTRWGMWGNFLDIPTDCPQRDERYGWTGDAQIFSGTACFNMDTYAFYTKFGYDLACEQSRLNGAVPDVVPTAGFTGTISTAWGEAATIIPWNVYLHYGDPGILRRQFDSMRGWVDYMKREDDAHGSRRLWQSGFHYGDWLALDGNVDGGVYGGTDPFLISSAYYYYSTRIVAKSAEILGRTEDAAYYQKLADEIHDAFIKEYFSPAGRLCVDTMTAYVVVLYMGLTPDYALENVRKGLLNKLARNNYHLETGFVGTPYLMRVLSDNGMNDCAYHLLLEKGFPGWLYEVLMGATTIWERWNSVLPDGSISGTEMNSLNHYSYGSVVEWMFRDMLGINPDESCPGFAKFRLAPKPNYSIPWAKGYLRSASGLIRIGYRLSDGELTFHVTVPFNTEAELILPDADPDDIRCAVQIGRADENCSSAQGNSAMEKLSEIRSDRITEKKQNGSSVSVTLLAGNYTFCYRPTKPYRKVYSLDSLMSELNENPKTKAILDKYFYSVYKVIPFEKELFTLRQNLNGPFTYLPYETQEKLDKMLREVE
ncbi:MAG: family 78 glycoside hydrolase catalytic domain [Bilifractor sp.]